MAKKKWDIKRGYGVYRSVYTEQLSRWIKEDKIKKGEVFVWTSGMSGWRRPEDLDEFRGSFKKKKKKKKKIFAPLTKDKKTKSAKVIIIDDEKDMCWLLENELRKSHFDVISANSGGEGIELIKQNKPDVVLLDLRLGDMDGIKLLKKIKELWPMIKIIVISAFGGIGTRNRAVKLGAEDFVDKPFKSQVIIKKIKRLV